MALDYQTAQWQFSSLAPRVIYCPGHIGVRLPWVSRRRIGCLTHDDSYNRTASIANASERRFQTETEARAFMDAQGVVSGEANEIIRVHNGPRTADPIKIAGIPAGTLNLMNHSFGI
jgi:hypothetical protein